MKFFFTWKTKRYRFASAQPKLRLALNSVKQLGIQKQRGITRLGPLLKAVHCWSPNASWNGSDTGTALSAASGEVYFQRQRIMEQLVSNYLYPNVYYK